MLGSIIVNPLGDQSVLWQIGQRRLEWQSASARPECPPVRIMGVLNVTPDSFSDGGLYLDADAAVSHGLRLVEEGASIIDVGGESTRPGSEPVSAEVELERVLPVIKGLRAQCDAFISIDTNKAAVAAAAVERGADIINDVSALQMDPGMLDVVRGCRAGVVLMHMRGKPKDMQEGDLSCADMTGHVVESLQERIDCLASAGVALERICVDPGIGFGKSVDQNLEIINRLDRLVDMGRPVLLGVSRKSVIGSVTGQPVEGRLAGTCAAHAIGTLRGAHLLRVHDVRAAADAVAVAHAIGTERGWSNG